MHPYSPISCKMQALWHVSDLICYLYRYQLSCIPIYAYPYSYIDMKSGHTRLSIFVYMHTQCIYAHTNMDVHLSIYKHEYACVFTRIHTRSSTWAYAFIHIYNYAYARHIYVRQYASCVMCIRSMYIDTNVMCIRSIYIDTNVIARIYTYSYVRGKMQALLCILEGFI